MLPGNFTRYILTVGSFLLLFAACKDRSNNSDKAIVLSLSGNDTAAVSALLKKANSFNQSNYDSLRYYGNEALAMAKSIRFAEGIARARGMEANYQRRKGNYDAAVAICLEVIHVYDSLKTWPRLVRMKNVLADIYKEMGGEKGTLEYLQKALELSKEGEQIAEREKYIVGITMSLNEQGIILRDMSGVTGREELLDSAYFLYNKGIELAKKNGLPGEELSPFYNNISQILNEHYKNYKKALEYQMLAVEINKQGGLKTGLTYNYNTISEIYRNMNDYQHANEYAHLMLALSKEIKVPFRMVDAYSALSESNKKLGRYDSALYYYELSTVLSDSLNNLAKSSQIAESQTKYETGKKEERISELGKMNQIKNQRLWLAFGLVGLFVVMIIVSVLQNRRLRKQKAHITEQSNRVQWMMKELHHRVKNNLQIVSSLLSLQTYRSKDEESVNALKESQLRVQAMSLMHQRLYMVEDVSMVNFKLYLDDLVETLMRSYGFGADDFDLQIKIDKEFLDVDTVMPMGLLVNEIITNSFKYAYKNVKRPLLHISLTSDDQRLLLDIKDNGPGLDKASTEQNSQGFGKKLIAALSKQLKATYLVDSSAGTVYHFIIPDNKEKVA